MRNMFDSRAKLTPVDNDRYPGVRFDDASERAERRVRGSLRALERPDLPELAVWLPAGLIAMAAKMTATRKRRIRRDYRRERHCLRPRLLRC
jgi:hypothetical protein